MKWFRRILIGLVALALLFAAVGLALPSRFSVERSVMIAAPAEKVYPLIASPAASQSVKRIAPNPPAPAAKLT